MRKIFLLLTCFLLVACDQRTTYSNGYIDADLVYLSSNYPGRLTDLAVTRGESVTKDQLLFKLEETSEGYAVSINELSQQALAAQRKEILDRINFSKTQYSRALRMNLRKAASQNDVDVTKKDLDVLHDQLSAIDSQIKSSAVTTATSEWQIKRKQNSAPDNGLIFDTYFTQGEYVQSGQPVISLITADNIKVIFFVSEEKLSKVKLNSEISISADGEPKFAKGKITYISNIAQYTPPIIYSREDREKLVFRVEAKINQPDLTKIHLGQPVSLEFM